MPEGYYVSIQRGSGRSLRTGLLLGPYHGKTAAEADVPEGRRLAERADPRAAFDAYGVTRVVAGSLPDGALNGLWGTPDDSPVTAYRHEGTPP